MKGLMWIVFCGWALCLSACQTYGSKELAALREPIFKADPENDLLRLRLRVNSGVTPIHSIRFEEKEDNSAKVTLTKLDRGYRIKGEPRFKSRKTIKIKPETSQAFKALVDRVDYWNLTNPVDVLWMGEDGGFCMNPTSFHFDGMEGEKSKDYFFSICLPIREGLQLHKALYEMARIDENDDWSVAEYWSEVWKEPEFQDLLE